MKYFWLKDEPPDLSSSDAFAVRQLVDRLLPLIESSPYPFTIALSGSWGAGKTTVAAELADEFRRCTRPVCEIDLWTEDIASLRRTVVIEASVALRAKKGQETAERKRVAEELDKATRASRSTPLPATVNFSWRAGALTLLNHKVNALLGLALFGALLSGIWYAEARNHDLVAPLSSLTIGLFTFLALKSGLFISLTNTTETMAPASVEIELHRKFVDLVSAKEDSDPPVLVVLDNLDRLHAVDALAALRQVRSLVGIRGSRCVFLIPVDRTAFVRQLGNTLGGPEDARDYLDKFFNLDIPLTQPEPVDLRGWARGLLNDVFADENLDPQVLSDTAAVLASAAQGSPRFVKRVINGVSTRLRMLEPSVRVRTGLPQIALVEALIARFPQLVEALAARPRQFTEMRDSLVAAADRNTARQHVDVFLAQFDEEKRPSSGAVSDLLLANSGVPLAADVLRQVLSLREERFWKGVPDPQRLEGILAVGDSGAFSTYLKEQDDDTARVVRTSVAAHIVRLEAERFPRNAVTAYNAASEELAADATAERSAREAVLASLLELGANDGAAQLTPVSARSAFSAVSPRVLNIWEKVLRELATSTDAPFGQQLVRVLRYGAEFVNPTQRARAIDVVASLNSDDALAPLFEPSVERTLLQGAVATRYGQRLLTWDAAAAAPAQELVALAAGRLQIAEEAGWYDAALLEQIATGANAQVPRVNPFPASSLAVLDGIVDALRGHRSAGVNTLALTLASWAGTPRERTIAAALRLPVDASTSGQFKSVVESWLAGADLTAIRSLLSSSRDSLSATTIDFRGPLLTRWVAGQGTNLCDWALEDGNGSATEAFVRSLTNVTDATLTARLTEVADILSSRLGADGVDAVEKAFAARFCKIPLPGLAGTEALLDKLSNSGSDLVATVEQLRARTGAAPRDELDRLAEIARAIMAVRPGHALTLLRATADRATQLGGAAPGVLAWLFNRDELRSELGTLTGLLEREIRNPTNTARTIVDLVLALRSTLAGDPRVRFALVQASAAAGVDCTDTAILLAEAVEWRPVESTSQRDELAALVDQIAPKCPEIVEPLRILRM